MSTDRPPTDAAGGFRCGTCDSWHDGLPLSFHVPAPAVWSPELEDREDSILDDELCVIHGEHHFIRGLIRVPVVGHDVCFEWGVWASLSEGNFRRTIEGWDRAGREKMAPMFGWLSVALPTFAEPTLSLKTMVHTQPIGHRPLIELEPTDHPLAVEQREGISWAQLQRRVAVLLGPA